MFESMAAMGYDHGHDAGEVFYLGPALDEGYVEGWLERIGEDDPNEEEFLRGVWERRPGVRPGGAQGRRGGEGG